MRFPCQFAKYLLGGLCAAVFVTGFAQEAYPSSTIKIVAPFAAGGTADVLARAIALRLGNMYGTPVVVENRPGAGGNLGAEAVAKSRPDGYTLVLGTIGIHSAYSVYSKISYNPASDLQPVIVLGEVPCVIAVHPAQPFKSLDELVAYAKRNPGKLTYGSAGNGSSTHMVGELYQQAAGIQLTHVPYRGSAPAMNDLMGGQIDMMFELITTAGPIVKSGKIRPLAVTSRQRSAVLPEVPTVAELGLPGFEGTGWFTIATAAGVPKPVVDKLGRDINKILNAPEMQDTWKSLALTVIGGTPESGARFFSSETAKWTKVIKTANIRAD